MITMPATTRRLYVTGHTVMALRHPSIGMGFNWRVDLWGRRESWRTGATIR